MSKRVLKVVGGILTSLAFATFFVRAALKVRDGHGADAYQNVYGLSIHWIDALTMLAALLVAVLAGFIVRWWQNRDVRAIAKFEAESHSMRADASQGHAPNKALERSRDDKVPTREGSA